MLSSKDPTILSNVFMKNQDFLQPLIKEKDTQATNRLSGSYESSQPMREQPADYQPIRESYPAMSPTRIFTYDPSTGISRLRKYDVSDEDRPSSPSLHRPSSPPTYLRPSSPPLTRADKYRPSSPLAEFYPERPTSPLLSSEDDYTSSSSSRGCPHCTIHSWLPHSPGCLNRLRK